jgi:hypothetical protein
MAEQSTMNGGKRMWTILDGEDKEALKAALELEGYCLSKRKDKCKGCVLYLAFDNCCPFDGKPGDSEIGEVVYNSNIAFYDRDKDRQLIL